jgi:osmotically-inducible protein OsmY
MSPNFQLDEEVRNWLARDPRIPHAAEIAVSGDGGIVTLRGTVNSFKERRAAVQDARRPPGVYEVIDELEVRPLDDIRDDELRGAILQRLLWNANVPSDSIDISVAAGWVTLKGEVRHQFQSDAAFDDVASTKGVGGITNKIKVVTAV